MGRPGYEAIYCHDLYTVFISLKGLTFDGDHINEFQGRTLHQYPQQHHTLLVILIQSHWCVES